MGLYFEILIIKRIDYYKRNVGLHSKKRYTIRTFYRRQLLIVYECMYGRKLFIVYACIYRKLFYIIYRIQAVKQNIGNTCYSST